MMAEENPHATESSSSRQKVVVSRADRVTAYLVFTVFSAFWGAVEFGWNTGVINNPKDSIMVMINESTANTFQRQLNEYELNMVWGTVVSIFAIGGMIGALLGGIWSEKFGRKIGMLINCGIGLVAAVLMALSYVASSFIMLIIGRFVVGFCSALFTCLVPMYITEAAHASIRGGIGVLNQLGVVVGLLLAQIVSIDEVLGGRDLWPWLMGLAAVPCLLQICMLPFCPESPRHLLITKKNEDEALKVLVKLRGHDDVDDEIHEMISEERSRSDSIIFLDLFRIRKLFIPLIVGVVLHLSQQFSGINVIFYYSSELFKMAGAEDNIAKFSTIGVGAIMVIMTGVSIPLMDYAGRRTLHLLGLLGITICSVGFTVLYSVKISVSDAPDSLTYASIVFALLIVVFFAIGPGSIPWMMMSEMFAQDSRSSANSVGVLVNWLANFVVGLIFPVLATNLSTYLFLPFSVLTLTFLIVLYFIMPETKNKTIDEIISGFSKNVNKRSPGQVSPSKRLEPSESERILTDKPNGVSDIKYNTNNVDYNCTNL